MKKGWRREDENGATEGLGKRDCPGGCWSLECGLVLLPLFELSYFSLGFLFLECLDFVFRVVDRSG